MQIFVPIKAMSSSVVQVQADGLFCSENGRCTPFTSMAKLSLLIGKDHVNGSLRNAPNTLPFGEDPTEHLSDVSAITTSELTMNKQTNENNQKDLSTALITKSLPSFTPVFLSGSVSGLLQAILLGILAGFILNFMPCVFPVLSIKLFGIISGGHDRNKIISTGFFYTTGILTSFIILASLVAFAGYSWGSLFQKTEFLVLMILVLFIFALSLMGVYTINVPGIVGKSASRQFSNQHFDSYIKGLLAALLATPCSGPFLGATLAWSVTKPPVIIFIIFLSVGTGMALPYILIMVRPSLLSFLPKPGNWMLVLEKIMGFILFGSVIYFISILNPRLFIPSLLMLLIGAIALWQFGEWGNMLKERRTKILSTITLAILLIGSMSIPVYVNRIPPTATFLHSIPFSYSSLISNSDKSVSVVVFTADWCPNCRVVERSVLKDDGILKLFNEKRISYMIADITDAGTEGEQLLHKLGSTSIPFLAVFPKGKSFSSPICLRDIYTKDDLRKAISMAEK
ncbi:MAG TPA: cytochrome c biogenesis protein CcdA [Spirochaetota bacterium]